MGNRLFEARRLPTDVLQDMADRPCIGIGPRSTRGLHRPCTDADPCSPCLALLVFVERAASGRA